MNHNTSDNNIEELIAKYLAGETSSAEELLIEEWVKASDDNRKYFHDLRKNWRMVKTGSLQFDHSKAWDKISDQINKDDNREKGSTRIVPFYRSKVIWRVAATVALIVVAMYSYIFITQTRQHRIVAESTPAETELKDGTSVTVNRASTLSYHANYGKDSRKVSLEGEAYFEVEKKPEKPFIVEADDIKIRVIGTSFLVRSFETDTTVSVSVTTGEVAMIAQNRDTLLLAANQTGIYSKSTGTFSLEISQNPNLLSWKTLHLDFYNTGLKEVFKTLEHTYGVQFVLNDENLDSCKLTAIYSNKSLTDVLAILRATFSLRFSKTGDNTITVYGTPCN
ncbi:MAG: FecR family protein [Bacteroidales bacterium]